MAYNEVYEFNTCTVSIKPKRDKVKVTISSFPKTHLKELLRLINKAAVEDKRERVKMHPYAIVREIIARTYDFSDKQKNSKCFKWHWRLSEYSFKKIRRTLNKNSYKDVEMKILNGYLRVYIPYKYLEDGWQTSFVCLEILSFYV
jgi:hypothetical protein